MATEGWKVTRDSEERVVNLAIPEDYFEQFCHLLGFATACVDEHNCTDQERKALNMARTLFEEADNTA